MKKSGLDRTTGRYARWLDENYDTNYWRFRHLWRPKNKFELWWSTHGSDAYEKQSDRSTVKRWSCWEGTGSDLMLFTYPQEIKNAYNKKKKEIKSVYKPLGRG